VEQPDVVRAPVAPRARVREQRAVVTPDRIAVARTAAVGQQSMPRVGGIERVELVELVAAFVHREHELRVTRTVRDVADRLVEERELMSRAAGEIDAMELGDLGEARRDI